MAPSVCPKTFGVCRSRHVHCLAVCKSKNLANTQIFSGTWWTRPAFSRHTAETREADGGHGYQPGTLRGESRVCPQQIILLPSVLCISEMFKQFILFLFFTERKRERVSWGVGEQREGEEENPKQAPHSARSATRGSVSRPRESRPEPRSRVGRSTD